jgi:hypothetical protein
VINQQIGWRFFIFFFYTGTFDFCLKCIRRSFDCEWQSSL